MLSAPRASRQVAKPPRSGKVTRRPGMVITAAGSGKTACAAHSYVSLGDSVRLALMITPRGRGTFREQAREVVSAMRTVLSRQPQPMVVTVQTIFLKDERDQAECERLLAALPPSQRPVTNYVFQPPCGGAALALEAWAIGGEGVRVERFGPHTLAVSYDAVRWVYSAGIRPDGALPGAYTQTSDVLGHLRAALDQAGTSFPRVVRTWFYLGGITGPDKGGQRYQELNRARTDFYHDIRFHCASPSDSPCALYPASTGIGMAGDGLVASCLALETRREDVFLLPLENPRQVPAYTYHPKYSPRSPKFSRAVALALGHYVTTWVSGTASIVDSESLYPGDPEKQTEQTIDNIEQLITAENFAAHGLKGAGARLQDMAKIRVYLKRQEDLAKCQAICERRFGAVPAIYAVADICRPELLVEIEGVAFSKYSPPKGAAAEPSKKPPVATKG